MSHGPSALPWELGNQNRVISRRSGSVVAQCLWEEDARLIVESVAEVADLRIKAVTLSAELIGVRADNQRLQTIVDGLRAEMAGRR